MRVISTFNPASTLPAPISERKKANKVVARDADRAIQSSWRLELESFGLDPATSTKIEMVTTPSSAPRITTRRAIEVLHAMVSFRMHDNVVLHAGSCQC